MWRTPARAGGAVGRVVHQIALRVRLEVRGSNSPAQSFYHRSGYRLVGRIPGYYDRRETALVLVKDLA